ncbi:hypothetical protein CEXT_546541 [Caerostris extrusa]|uniref:Uncharacterized protein n=1 Tax=Caerostris extrusa TaxID=172846 RepID=A0AAV4QIU1_CAEEX|nr:hypothetical protein CEXT_546541 [Caerostris extrusa]
MKTRIIQLFLIKLLIRDDIVTDMSSSKLVLFYRDAVLLKNAMFTVILRDKKGDYALTMMQRDIARRIVYNLQKLSSTLLLQWDILQIARSLLMLK